MKLNELTVLLQLDIILSYRVRQVPVHMVAASVVFVQLVSDDRAYWAIPQELHKLLVTLTNVAAVYKLKVHIKNKVHKPADYVA